MKILVTGAHFTPALAVIEELRKIDGLEIVYVGRNTTQEGDVTPSVELEVLSKEGVKFISIIAGRLQRSFTIYTIPSLLKIPIGFFQALYILLCEKPDVILSFGGYVAVPIVIIGWLFSIPIIIHEQTLVFGLANKISSYFADKVAVSFEDSEIKGEKVILTGNPVRRVILQGDERQKSKELPVILITGGNQGSHAINLAVEECLSELLKIGRVYHQTGDSKYRDFERLENLGDFGNRYIVKKWIGEEYGDILQKTDLVISRAGINTLTELAILGKPTLIIPISNKEQKMNAKYFTEHGLGETLSQFNLSGETLLRSIKLMLNSLGSFKDKAKEARKIIIPDGARRLALEILLLKHE